MLDRLRQFCRQLVAPARRRQQLEHHDAILAAYQARLTAIVSSLRDGILLVNDAGLIEYANQQLCEQFRIARAPETLVGMRATEFLGMILPHYDDPEAAARRIAICVTEGEAVLGEEVNLANGRVLLRDFIPFSQGQNRIGRLWHHRDITALRTTQRELAEANRILADLSATDGLTGLANRRRFDQALAAGCSAPAGTAIGLILLDVDFFKPYNDRYGHLAGDECLKRIARTLSTGADQTDLVARYGGEEFAIVVEAASLDAAAALAEELRAAIQALAIPHADVPNGVVTISLGVAVLPLSAMTDVDRLISLADTALYRAKHDGRNRVIKALASTTS